MRRYSSADSALRDWWELRCALSSPRSLYPVKERGLVFGKRCAKAKCKGARWIEKRQGKGLNPIPVCARCSEPWPVEIRFLLANEIQSAPRTSGTDDRLAEIATLELTFSRLHLWERRVWTMHVLESQNLDQTIEEARRRWPRATHAWTRYRIRLLLFRARERVMQGLRRAALHKRAE